MGQLDSVVFGNKKFSDILEEIYNNQKEKRRTSNSSNLRVKTIN